MFERVAAVAHDERNQHGTLHGQLHTTQRIRHKVHTTSIQHSVTVYNISKAMMGGNPCIKVLERLWEEERRRKEARRRAAERREGRWYYMQIPKDVESAARIWRASEIAKHVLLRAHTHMHIHTPSSTYNILLKKGQATERTVFIQ